MNWYDSQWNFVWGCNERCPYCISRIHAKRYGNKIAKSNGLTDKSTQELINFKPTFLPSSYMKKLPKKSQNIYVSSMSDPGHWNSYHWMVFFEKISENSQHVYLLLTKRPDMLIGKNFPDNVWIGISAETQKSFEIRMQSLRIIDCEHRFVVFQPLFEEIRSTCDFKYLDWVIVGAEYGAKRKHTPLYFIDNLVSIAKKWELPVYIDSIDGKKVKRYLSQFPKHLQLRKFPVGLK
jgi:protein gp37